MMDTFLKMPHTPFLTRSLHDDGMLALATVPPYLFIESSLKMLLTPSLSLPDDGELPQDAPHPQPLPLLT